MAKRKVEVVLICEDNQHEAFVRRFLQQRGYDNRKIHVKKSPSGRGSAEQWVLIESVPAIGNYRTRHVTHKVIIMRDGDSNNVAERSCQMDDACKENNCEPRRPDEKIALFVPCRNIETWIAYLEGETVDETRAYRKLTYESGCSGVVDSLIKMCDQGHLREPFPQSLQAACDEYKSRIR